MEKSNTLRIIILILLFIPCFAIAADHGTNFGRPVYSTRQVKEHGKGPYMDKYGYVTVYNGSRTTYGTHSGNLSLSQSGTGYTLTTYDTLTVTGTFGDMEIQNISGVGNCIDGIGATITNASFQQPEWLGLANLTVMGFAYSNYNGKITWKKTIHNFKLLNVSFINTGTYRSEPAISVDGPFITDMVFTGSLSQTFYNDSIVGCTFRGFQDIDVVRIGSNWGGGTEQNRSIALNWFIHGNTVDKITNTTSGFNVISGTGANMEFCHNHIDSIAVNAGAGPRNHTAVVLWYGTINYHDNDDQNEYAQALRNYTLRWTGLPGYDTLYTKIWRNRSKKKASYSAFEGSHTGAGNRNSGNGFYPARIEVWNNTVDSTVANTYHAGGGPDDKYHGVLIDLVNFDTAIIKNNVCFKMEMDYPIDSVAQKGYFNSEIGSAATHKTISNNFSSRWVKNNAQDSTDYMPTVAGPLRHAAAALPWFVRATDKNGNTGDDIGWINYYSAGSPPSCATNTSPANGATIGTQTTATISWGTVATAISYDVYVNGALWGNTVSTTWGLTGLTASSTLSWYVVPKNASGDATGCSSTATTFTTAGNPPSCTTNTATTAISQTGATIHWNTAAGATGYHVYFWLNGGSAPGSPTFDTSSTSLLITGLTAGFTYRFYITPYNTYGDATGCSTVYTTFATLPVPPTFIDYFIYRQ